MIALIQRVSEASVKVDDKITGEINKGLLVFVAIEPTDNNEKAQRLAQKIAGYRVFEDVQGKMNLNVKQVKGEILVVSQFTLAADTSKGLRPSFTSAAQPEISENLYLCFCENLNALGFNVQTGVFGADIKVSLLNDGPVTFSLTC